MNISWLSLNASWSHSSLALPMLEQCCRDEVDWKWSVVNATLHEAPERIVEQLLAQNPDVVLATCYLFTVEAILKVLCRFHQLHPEIPIVLGGPEFLGTNTAFLQRNEFVTAVVRGEGEAVIRPILRSIESENPDALAKLGGLCVRLTDGQIHDDGSFSPELPMDLLPDPINSPLFDCSKGFVQIETSRGCQSHCSFCTSALSNGGRMRSVNDVREILKRVRGLGIHAVRVLDRTFNYPKTRAFQLLQLFLQEFSDLHFHLEIYPNLVTDEMLELIDAAKPGQLHIEIGIQSTSPTVLSAVKRSLFSPRAFEVLDRLCHMPNIPLHADLIVGLPNQRFEDIRNDLEMLSVYQPEEIQIEVLKVLNGTPLTHELEACGIVHSPVPPYEVLKTNTLAFTEIRRSMRFSRLLDHFYNHCELRLIVGKFWRLHPDLWSALESFFADRIDFETPINLSVRYRLFYDFLSAQESELAHELVMEWIRNGHSPQKGLWPADIWKDEIPGEAMLVRSNEVDDPVLQRDARTYYLEFPEYRYWIKIYRQAQKEVIVLGEWKLDQ